MKLIKALNLFAVIVALLFVSAPSFAQREDRSRESQPRGQARPRRDDGRQTRRGARPESRPAERPRAGDQRRRPTAVPRPDVRVAPRSRVYMEPRGYGYVRPRVMLPIAVYPRPYYVFRPRFFIGFGIYVGFPVPYPIAYGYPTYVFGSAAYPPEPPSAGVAVQPPPGTYGGISLDITPEDATVSVDGAYVGSARDFAPTRQPLTLTPGRHHLELQAAGMVPLAFDVDVVAGEVQPYRGTLQPR